MNKQITFARKGNYNGRNGNAPMTGIAVANIEEVSFVGMDAVRLTPVNTRGEANSTWMDVPKEDIPALIDLLREAIGQTSDKVRMFHLATHDSDAGSMGTIRGTTPEELTSALKTAIAENNNVDIDTVNVPDDIDWDFWHKHHTEEIIVSYNEDGHYVNQTITATYTWEN